MVKPHCLQPYVLCILLAWANRTLSLYVSQSVIEIRVMHAEGVIIAISLDTVCVCVCVRACARARVCVCA
jgi:hypothetical protein